MDIRNYITQCNLQCTSCEYKNTLCRDINYLNSKDKALTYKHKIYLTRRNYENTKSVEPDLVLELFIAENIELTSKDILRKYNYVDDYEYNSNMIQKVNRIKRKIKSMYTDNFVENYLCNTDMKSFKQSELDIYVEAINYLHSTLNFQMSYIKHPHKKYSFKGNWFELGEFLNNNPNIFRGNELYFLGSFCKGNKKKRDLCNRLIIDLGVEEAFSYADIDYVLQMLKELSYTKDMFFKHLNYIKTFNSKN